VYPLLCQSLTERVTLHIYYFSKLHVAWSLSAGHELIAHYTACATIVVLFALSYSLCRLPSNEYWHNPSLISIFPSIFTSFSNGPEMNRKKLCTFSYSICIGIYNIVCDTTAVLAAANNVQSRLNTVNVLVHITVISIERKMSSVSPPRDEETAGKYICQPLTISVNINTLSRYPVNLMSYIPLCFCTAALALSLPYFKIFSRYHCLKLTFPARNGPIYYGE
jgi:hypothetical protein